MLYQGILYDLWTFLFLFFILLERPLGGSGAEQHPQALSYIKTNIQGGGHIPYLQSYGWVRVNLPTKVSQLHPIQ